MKALTILILSALLLVGCVSSRSGKVYTHDQARQAHSVKMGTVTHVANVLIEGKKSGTGAMIGAIAGGVAGSTVSNHNDSAKLGSVLGGLLDGVGGAAAEERLTQKQALEITVRLDSGSALVVVQEADVYFNVGDRVRLVEGHGATRVRH